jgi:hypothetical protein
MRRLRNLALYSDSMFRFLDYIIGDNTRIIL